MISTYEFLATWLRARFSDTERGASLVEYALLVALIAVICIVALQFLGQRPRSRSARPVPPSAAQQLVDRVPERRAGRKARPSSRVAPAVERVGALRVALDLGSWRTSGGGCWSISRLPSWPRPAQPPAGRAASTRRRGRATRQAGSPMRTWPVPEALRAVTRSMSSRSSSDRNVGPPCDQGQVRLRDVLGEHVEPVVVERPLLGSVHVVDEVADVVDARQADLPGVDAHLLQVRQRRRSGSGPG